MNNNTIIIVVGAIFLLGIILGYLLWGYKIWGKEWSGNYKNISTSYFFSLLSSRYTKFVITKGIQPIYIKINRTNVRISLPVAQDRGTFIFICIELDKIILFNALDTQSNSALHGELTDLIEQFKSNSMRMDEVYVTNQAYTWVF